MKLRKNRASVPPKKDEESIQEGSRAPILAHLMALRQVLIVSAIAVLVGFVLIYYLCIDALMAWIIEPIVSRGIEVIYTAMSEALVTKFKVALIAACIVASPVIIYEAWGFIRPALYDREVRLVRTLFFVALLLFLVGVTFCYFAVYTLAVEFFLVAGDNLATPMMSLDKYVGFLFGFILPFGVAFQLPVFLFLTTRFGFTSYQGLAGKRKFVILGVFVLAAILTPPDVVSQLALGIPMLILFEVGLQVCRLTKPRNPDVSDDG
ncbi:MAG: twin-arginine translocase subunit TatC [Clostridia bacterium]|nr:twin-arginine translocase subunit TatC [Clostridia bacterium]